MRSPARSSVPPAAVTAVQPAAVPAVVLAGVLDVVVVVAFVAAGRSSHAESGGVVGVLTTAWPFLVACAVGWLVLRVWRSPWRVWPAGVALWAVTGAGGLALRGLAGGGLAPAFVAVAAGVLAVGLVGWRTVATLLSGSARRRPVGSARGR
ncbi:DUF3054 domain-containing protein [uncultured Cellulomonas sp.]|uniref:DUF3054 domain-containing protein n=1 Tax=uncultured Cellulomonas sp. TaxID=189682 RepID=UPI00262E9DCE|nr:DUF3054 domain-containing protein [uncultured Cellulomonas sp.]